MLAWLAAAALAAPPDDVPTVDLAEEADLHFRLGVEQYKASNFRGALDHLLQSNRLAPNRNTAFNVARCYEQLERPDQAWRYYAASLTADASPADRASVDEALVRLDSLVARVVVTSEPPGATVYIDREDLGVRGATPVVLALPPGEHRVRLALEGYAPAEVSSTLIVGNQVKATAALVPIEQTDERPALSRAPRWVRSTVRAGDVVVLEAQVGSCAVLPGLVSAAATWTEPERHLTGTPLGATASLDVEVPLALDVVIEVGGVEHTTRLALQRADRRAAWLADAAPLRSWILDRCAIADGGAVASALAGLPKATRLDAVAVLAELGDGPLGRAADACARGDCTALGAGLTPSE